MFWGFKILILPKSNQTCPNLITFAQVSPQFWTNFALVLPKSNQLCPNLINFAQKNFARGCGCNQGRNQRG